MKLLNDKMEVSELIHFYLFYNYNYCYFFLLYMATFFAAAHIQQLVLRTSSIILQPGPS